MKKVNFIIGAVAVSLLSGCAATGTKNVDLFGLIQWENFAGQKVYAGYENIDQLDERRAVGYKKNDGLRMDSDTKKQNNNERY